MTGQVAAALAQGLADLGVQLVFGVSGGGVAGLWSAIGDHPDLRLIHTQHESGAAFAACEASLASGRPAAVLVTTGPGLSNAVTGLIAARHEGARVILLSGLTPASRRGRGPTQETSPGGPLPGLFVDGPVFHLAQTLESAEQVECALRRLALALSAAEGGVAHLGVPGDVALLPLPRPARVAPVHRSPPEPDPALLDELAPVLRHGRAVLLVGRAARGAEVAELARRCAARVVCTPDAKGVMPEDDPHYAGVIGVAGHDSALAALQQPFDLLLVLGARLGEAETGWHPALRPRERLVCVGESPDALVGSYVDAACTWVPAAPARVVERLLQRLPAVGAPPRRPASPPRVEATSAGLIHPVELLQAIQAEVVDGSDALLLAESGASFAWAIHLLRLPAPRLRVSVGWGSMGHATTGAIGAAATGRRALALVGDGALLMGNELLTAVRHRLPVTWVVLDDQGYGMCRHGMRAQGFSGVDLDQPAADFAGYARALGLQAARVERADDLGPALRAALSAAGPSLVSVRVDPSVAPPMGRRIQALTFHPGDAA